MKISDIVILILGDKCSVLAIDICSCILFFAYSLILICPFYVIYSILKYKRLK